MLSYKRQLALIGIASSIALTGCGTKEVDKAENKKESFFEEVSIGGVASNKELEKMESDKFKEAKEKEKELTEAEEKEKALEEQFNKNNYQPIVKDKKKEEPKEDKKKVAEKEKEKEKTDKDWFNNDTSTDSADKDNLASIVDDYESKTGKNKQTDYSSNAPKTEEPTQTTPNPSTPKKETVTKKPEPEKIPVKDTKPVKPIKEVKPPVKLEPPLTDAQAKDILIKGLDKMSKKMVVKVKGDLADTMEEATYKTKHRMLISAIDFTVVEEENGMIYTVKPEYNTTQKQYDTLVAYAKKFKEKVKKPGVSTEEILTALNENMINMGAYDDSKANIHSPYTLYNNKYGVCQAYTAMAKIMLDELGIKNGLGVGSADGIPHTWNVVSVNGELLHIDFTWNDSKGDDLEYFLLDSEGIAVSRELQDIFMN